MSEVQAANSSGISIMFSAAAAAAALVNLCSCSCCELPSLLFFCNPARDLHAEGAEMDSI